MLATQRRIHRRPQSAARAEAAAQQLQPGALVPYDATARFQLTGQPGRIVQDVINISPDAVFIAVAIGYGFEQDRMGPLLLVEPGPNPPPPRAVGKVTLANISIPDIIEGFRIDPKLEDVVFK